MNSISSERIRSAILKLEIDGVIAPASSREMSSSAPRISSIASSESSMFSTSRDILAAALPLDQARDIEPRRVQRLQDVVAGGGQEARLGDVGVFGRALGQRQLGIEPRQFLGAVAHALFQRGVGALQRFGRLEARRDVGEGDDEAAARHAVGAHLDHHVAVGKTLQIGLAFGGVGGEPPFAAARRRRRCPAATCAHDIRGFPSGECRSAPDAAAAPGFRRTAGWSRSAAGRRRTRRCPGAHG